MSKKVFLSCPDPQVSNYDEQATEALPMGHEILSEDNAARNLPEIPMHGELILR